MSKDEIDSKKFKKWLDRQIKEAKLTPSEIADFNKWLMTRSGSDDEDVERKNRENGDISAKDVVEFVSWAKGRMSDLILPAEDRRQFTKWLALRLKATSGLSDDEVRGVVDEL
jgi:hypothetical protein